MSGKVGLATLCWFSLENLTYFQIFVTRSNFWHHQFCTLFSALSRACRPSQLGAPLLLNEVCLHISLTELTPLLTTLKNPTSCSTGFDTGRKPVLFTWYPWWRKKRLRTKLWSAYYWKNIFQPKKCRWCFLPGIHDRDLVYKVEAVVGVDVQLDQAANCQFSDLIS